MPLPTRLSTRTSGMLGAVACGMAAALAIAFGWAALTVRGHAGEDTQQTIASLEASVAQLQQRIARLNDIDQIENLISVYGYYLDKQQWDQLADLFAASGSMEISLRGIYVGKQSIRRALELFGPQNIEPAHLHNHIQLQPVIEVANDGLHAWSRSRALSELGTYERIGLWGDGVYDNEYVKENGVWKIQKDHIYTTFFATYAKGWQSGAGPAPKVSEKIPPDRPPSETYQAYPGVYIPPFHYKHPVTGAPIEVPPALQVKPNPGASP
ncbi:MAG TPA: nuclear transport factor 2 family protein [Steroidobacteraceae bacterium]|nr:nuclear transport factor 2 family protein [Steroidobacteraceae bacterium]